MRYVSFRRHMEEVKQSHFFKPCTTGSRDAVGNASTSIELLVLGVLTGSLLSPSVNKPNFLPSSKLCLKGAYRRNAILFHL